MDPPTQGRDGSKAPVEQDKSNRLYNQFRLLYRQTSKKPRFVSDSPQRNPAATEIQKYVVKGKVSQALLVEQCRVPLSTRINRPDIEHTAE